MKFMEALAWLREHQGMRIRCDKFTMRWHDSVRLTPGMAKSTRWQIEISTDVWSKVER